MAKTLAGHQQGGIEEVLVDLLIKVPLSNTRFSTVG